MPILIIQVGLDSLEISKNLRNVKEVAFLLPPAFFDLNVLSYYLLSSL